MVADMPPGTCTRGLTLGLRDICSAQHVMLLVTGTHKAIALQEAMSLPVSPARPASFLRRMPGAASQPEATTVRHRATAAVGLEALAAVGASERRHLEVLAHADMPGLRGLWVLSSSGGLPAMLCALKLLK